MGRRIACSHCPVACIHIAALREPHPDEAYFYKTSMIGYDYEPIYAVGSMLGMTSPESILKLIDRIEVLGLDAMTAGVVLAWATEARQNGLISERQTDGIALRWGDHEAYAAALERIVRQPNDFYKALARGIYTPEIVTRALALSGFDLSSDALTALGQAIHRAKYRFKLREGFRPEELRLPKRIFQTPSPVRDWDESYLRAALGCLREAVFGQGETAAADGKA